MRINGHFGWASTHRVTWYMHHVSLSMSSAALDQVTNHHIQCCEPAYFLPFCHFFNAPHFWELFQKLKKKGNKKLTEDCGVEMKKGSN